MSQTLSGTIIGGGNIYSSPATKLDEELSSTSINAVQNKVITTELNKKLDASSFDMNNIVPKTAAAHNALCRGKDLTSYEARLNNEKDPYDTKSILAKRQEIRDKINVLQQQLDTLQAEEESINAEK